jgi:ABC-type multidrug transport system ATPase subunit
MKIIKILKKVAHAGSSVIFTIHQPSSDVFMSFDNLLLMNKGRIMSAVPAASTAEYFASRGHPVPVHFNPADWIMVSSTKTSDTLFIIGH